MWICSVSDLSENEDLEIQPGSEPAPAEASEPEPEPEIIEETPSESDEPEEDIDSFFG